MKKMKGGFTLIELLVVVLIIGILAAVALPQYRMSVQKVRMMRLLPLLRSISDAENVYFMTEGKYTLSFADLPIEMPAGGTLRFGSKNEELLYNDFVCWTHCNEARTVESFSAYCKDLTNQSPALERYFQSGKYFCWVEGEDRFSDKICRNISGLSTPTISTGGGMSFGYQF